MNEKQSSCKINIGCLLSRQYNSENHNNNIPTKKHFKLEILKLSNTRMNNLNCTLQMYNICM